MEGLVKIFVSIASYRDAQLPKTVDDLLAKATHPERVFVGIVNQLDGGGDFDCFANAHNHVRQIGLPYQESRGVCWARNMVYDQLLGDEDFVLQIDSHSRFEQGWDVEVLNQWHRLLDPKGVISHYPLAYYTNDNDRTDPMRYLRFTSTGFNHYGLPLQDSVTLPLEDAPAQAEKTPFIAGGCFFAPSSMVRYVQYDPFLYFTGEETSYAVRLWTHGYNIYLPKRPFMYHDYGVDRGRRMHSQDNPQMFQSVEQRSKARLRHLFGLEASTDHDVIEQISKYGFGRERSFSQWQMHFGIHFDKQLIVEDARRGLFNQEPLVDISSR